MSKKKKLKTGDAKAAKSPAAPAPVKKPAGHVPLPFWLRPHIMFAVLAFLFGTLFLVYTPPYQVPDEIAHFDRAYMLSEFKTLQKNENNTSGDYAPISIDSSFWLFRYLSWNPDKKTSKKNIIEAFKIPLENNKRKFTRIDGGGYFYFSYLPQYPAIYLGKLLNLNVLTVLYLGRLLALLFYIFFVYQAIRLIPFAKYLLLVIALMPICLAQAGSSNADCVAFAFSFFAVAVLVKYASSMKKISFNKETLATAFMLIIIGVLKIVYLPIIFLFFILPQFLFKNKRQYFAIATVLLVLASAFTIAWTKANAISLDDPATGAQEKIKTLLGNPFHAFSILNTTVPRSADIYYHTIIGVLGYLDTMLPEWVYKLYAFLIIFFALFEGSKEFTLKLLQRGWLLAISFAVFTGTILSMHLINGTENGLFVSGVQGRYFIPIVFPFFLAFAHLIPWRINFQKSRVLSVALYIILFIALLSSQIALSERFYG
jgi:uncharacterized membrane protein